MGWPFLVTLSAAKGLSRWASRCFAELTLSGANVLSMTVPSSCRAHRRFIDPRKNLPPPHQHHKPHHCTIEETSTTTLYLIPLPPRKTLKLPTLKTLDRHQCSLPLLLELHLSSALQYLLYTTTAPL